MSLASLRLLSLLGLALIVVFSVIPGGFQIRTGLPKEIEHFLAYFAVAAMIGIWRRSLWQAALAVAILTVLAGAMEVAQEFIPGRNGSRRDILASACGATAGAAAAMLWQRYCRLRRLERSWRAAPRRLQAPHRRRD